jgi:hypothetical protein
MQQFVAHDLKLKKWSGRLLEYEDWYQDCHLHCKGCHLDLENPARTSMFLSYLPSEYSLFLTDAYNEDHWTEPRMHLYLLDQVNSRVTSYTRKEAWLHINPTGPGYQSLYSWFVKWKRALSRLEVTLEHP